MTAMVRSGKANRPRPISGKCEACDHRIGRRNLVFHHCHDCGQFVAWLCDDCNLSLTEHALRNWERLAAIHRHECRCPARLFMLDEARSLPADRPWTRPLYMSNGGGDDRYVTISTHDGYITVEQLAVVIGVNANTARDIASGRQSNQSIGEKHGDTWLISHDHVLAYLEQRWRLT